MIKSKKTAFVTVLCTVLAICVLSAVSLSTLHTSFADGKNFTSALTYTSLKNTQAPATVVMDGYTFGTKVPTPALDAQLYENPNVNYYFSDTDSNIGGRLWEDITPLSLDAGTYYMYAVIGDTDNYSGYSTSTTEFTVQKAKLEKPSKDSTEFTFNGENQTYYIPQNDLYTVSNNVQTNAGNYTVTVSLNDKNNSSWTDDTTKDLVFNFVVLKAQNSISGLTVSSWKENEQGVPPTADSDFGTVNFVYSKANAINFNITELPTTAGSYVVKAYVNGNNNYSDASDEKEFTVYKIQVNLNGVQISNSENGIDPDAELVLETVNKDSKEGKKARELLHNKKVFSNNQQVYGILKISLVKDGTTVKLQGQSTVKIPVPSKIGNNAFKLYHVDGNKQNEVNFTDTGDGFVTFTTQSLDKFIFVSDDYIEEKETDNSFIFKIIGLAVVGIVLVLLLLYVIGYLFYRNGKLDKKRIKKIYKNLPKNRRKKYDL